MILFGALAGLIAGLAGSALMEGFQAAWSRARKALGAGSAAGAPGGEPHQLAAVAEAAGAARSDPATVKVAAVATSVIGTRLRKAQKEPAGRIVHYAFGAGTAIPYCMLAELTPIVTIGFGSLFGIAVWVGADNLLLWALGLAKRPTAYPLSTHAHALSSHLVFGLAVEAVRQLVRRLMPA